VYPTPTVVHRRRGPGIGGHRTFASTAHGAHGFGSGRHDVTPCWTGSPKQRIAGPVLPRRDEVIGRCIERVPVLAADLGGKRMPHWVGSRHCREVSTGPLQGRRKPPVVRRLCTPVPSTVGSHGLAAGSKAR